MIRYLVLSRAYQLSAEASPELVEADPENHLFGRQNRRRLAAEEIRDGVLFLAGALVMCWNMWMTIRGAQPARAAVPNATPAE